MKYLIYKEWILYIRNIQEIFHPVFFLIILATLFQIIIGTEPKILTKISPVIIWVGILLSILLSSENLYKDDFDDGSLEQLFLSNHSPLLAVYCKLFMQIIVKIFPIILATPVLAIFFKIDFGTLLIINLTLLIASPSLLLLAMLGSVITLSLHRGGMLLILIILPFYIPILIFSIAIISNYRDGLESIGQIAILGAILAFMLSVIPITIVTTLKASIAES